MEQLGNVLAGIVVFSSLWLVRKLTIREIHNEDLLGLKKESLSSMPLDDYERDLDKIFDYSKIRTISLNQEEIMTDEDFMSQAEEEKVEENVEKGNDVGDVPGGNNTSTS